MTSMRRISAPIPRLQQNCQARAGNPTGKLRQRVGIASEQTFQQHNPSSEHSYRQAFVKA